MSDPARRSGPRFSLLLPARNGAQYVGHAIRSVLDQTYEDFELVVSVDRSTDGTLDVVTAFDDPRLRVVEPDRQLSMAGHYEWCLSHARGDWITILGQDDAVMPYFFSASESVISRWPDATAISFRRAYYFWAGCEDVYGDRVVAYSPGRGERRVRTRAELLRVLAGFREHYDLPQIYTNNLIRRDVVDHVRQRSGGRFYHETTPDVYSGTAISLAMPTFLRCELPVFWTGTSPSSTGYAITKRAQGQANTRDRAAETHFGRARSEGLLVAEEVGEQLLQMARSSVTYVLSALRRVPFRSRTWDRRWVLYLAYAALFRAVDRRTALEPDLRPLLEQEMQAQIHRLRLRHGVLRLVRVGLTALRGARRITRAASRRMGTRSSNELPSIVSDDRSAFPDIDSASTAVAELEARVAGLKR